MHFEYYVQARRNFLALSFEGDVEKGVNIVRGPTSDSIYDMFIYSEKKLSSLPAYTPKTRQKAALLVYLYPLMFLSLIRHDNVEG